MLRQGDNNDHNDNNYQINRINNKTSGNEAANDYDYYKNGSNRLPTPERL